MEPPIRCELPPDLHELTLQILVFVPIHFESGSRVQEPAPRPAVPACHEIIDSSLMSLLSGCVMLCWTVSYQDYHLVYAWAQLTPEGSKEGAKGRGTVNDGPLLLNRT